MYFDEENLIRSFMQIENEVKLGFMSNLLKSDQVIENLTFPYDLQGFKDCFKWFFTLLSQVLGLDNDKEVHEVMVSLVYSVSQSEVTNQDINFDEFLVENIHSQLMNFHAKRTFRYQTLLLQIIVQQNWNELQKLDVDFVYKYSQSLRGIRRQTFCPFCK